MSTLFFSCSNNLQNNYEYADNLIIKMKRKIINLNSFNNGVIILNTIIGKLKLG